MFYKTVRLCQYAGNLHTYFSALGLASPRQHADNFCCCANMLGSYQTFISFTQVSLRQPGAYVRVTQEQQVEDRVVLEQVDQGPAQNPATQGQHDEPGGDHNHIPDQRTRAGL